MEPTVALTLAASLALNAVLFVALVWQRDRNDKLRERLTYDRSKDDGPVIDRARRGY